MTRLAAVAALLAILIVLPGRADATHAPASISIDDISLNEGDSGTTPFTFTVSRTDTTEESIVTTTVDPVSTEANDYVAPAATTLTFLVGEATKNVVVDVNGDTTYEDPESFQVTLSVPVNATIAKAVGVGTILNEDAPPTATVVAVAPSVAEAATASFKITLAAAAERPVTVAYRTADGSAEAGKDYTAVDATWTFPVDPATGKTETEKTIDVGTLADTLDEFDETFTFTVTGGSSATQTITDDPNDGPAAISALGDVTVVEGTSGVAGNTGTVPANFQVSVGASGKPITIRYATFEATATPGQDYESINTTVTVPPRNTAVTVTLSATVISDPVSENDEHFFVNLLSADNATLDADTQGKATITDDDDVPAPTVSDASTSEGNSGVTSLVFTVTLPARAKAATFDYRTVEGSATASGAQPDYQVAGGAVTFPASAETTTRTIPVNIVGDTLDENDESFTLELLRPADGSKVASATGTITNDDNNSKLEVGNGSVDEPSTGAATLKLNVTLSPASARAVSVGWSTANGTASAGSDYTASSGTLDFAPGETSKQISISVTGDTVNEENETVLVNLASASGAGVADAQGEGTIIDKNAPPSLSIDDVLTREGETATFTITLSGNTLRTVNVVAKTIEGTAKEGTEYHARRTLFTFAPGEKSKTFQVPGIDDTISEGIELYYVGLEDAVNATVTKSRGTATIDASDTVATVASPPLRPTVRPPATATRVLLPKMLLGPRTVVVNAGVARMLVTCAKNSPLACAGSVSFERVAKPKLVLGTKTFSVKPGKKGYAAIKLTAPALKLLAQKKTMPARAVVIVKTSAKNLTVAPGVVTLKQGKPALIRSVLVNAGVARMLVTCAKSSPLACAGSVSFERVAKPKLVLGTGTFSVKPGKKGYVAIKLTAPALKLLAQKKTMPARAVVIAKTSAKYLTFTPGPVTLKQGKPAQKAKTAPTEVSVDP